MHLIHILKILYSYILYIACCKDIIAFLIFFYFGSSFMLLNFCAAVLIKESPDIVHCPHTRPVICEEFDFCGVSNNFSNCFKIILIWNYYV